MVPFIRAQAGLVRSRVSDFLLASILSELVLRPSAGSRRGDTSQMIPSRSSHLKRPVQASNRSAERKSGNAFLVHDVATWAFSSSGLRDGWTEGRP